MFNQNKPGVHIKIQNENYNKSNVLTKHDSNSLENQNSKNKSDVQDKPIKPINNKITTNSFGKTYSQMSGKYIKNVKQNSSNNYKSREEQCDSRLTQEKDVKCQNTKQLKKNDSLSSRYHLNVGNYIIELHKALIKECKDNLLDYNSLDYQLDEVTLVDVYNRTFKAMEVRLTLNNTNNNNTGNNK